MVFCKFPWGFGETHHMCLLSPFCGLLLSSPDMCGPCSASSHLGCWALAILHGSLDVGLDANSDVVKLGNQRLFFVPVHVIHTRPDSLCSVLLETTFIPKEPAPRSTGRLMGLSDVLDCMSPSASMTPLELDLPLSECTYCGFIFELCIVPFSPPRAPFSQVFAWLAFSQLKMIKCDLFREVFPWILKASSSLSPHFSVHHLILSYPFTSGYFHASTCHCLKFFLLSRFLVYWEFYTSM